MPPRLFPGTAWVLALFSRKILYLGLVLQNSLGLEFVPRNQPCHGLVVREQPALFPVKGSAGNYTIEILMSFQRMI